MSTQPFSPHSTINTTQTIGASRATVWPVVRAMDQWSTFQDTFQIELVPDDDNTGVVVVGQDILITSDFPVIPQATWEQINEIIETERICWTLKGFELLGGLITLPSPPKVLRTARCIELFDNDDGETTILHNWISYAGLAWPAITLSTGAFTKCLFEDFNTALANQF